MTIRIGTWNILGRNHYRQGRSARPGLITSAITRHSIDVLCLQEVHFYDGQPEQQVVDALDEAGLVNLVDEPLSPSHLDSRASLGLVIASRYPLSGRRTHRLENPGISADVRGKKWTLHDKGLLGTAVSPRPGETVQIHTLHLFPFFEFGISEAHRYVADMWQEFWSYVDGSAGTDPLVLAGDFNHESRAKAAAHWSRNDWQFCFDSEATTENGLSLDDIAFNRPARISDRGLSPTFSDHRLAVVGLPLPEITVSQQAAPSMAWPG